MYSESVFLVRKPKLRRPVLVEGLPGIGFVANIVALHLISELGAKKFGEILSPCFQPFSLTSRGGSFRYPVNELYYSSEKNIERDIIILFGNSQAEDSKGQYDLCKTILDVAQNLGCEFIITAGGLRRDVAPEIPRIYCAASRRETLEKAKELGADIMRGRIYGAAGLLIGLAKSREIDGLCVLAETSGLFPDVSAARSALQFICKFLGLDVDCTRLDQAVENNKQLLDWASQPKPLMRPAFPGPV